MKEPNIFILIRFLEEDEAHDFKDHLISSKSDSSRVLFDFLNKHKREEWGEKLRKSVFEHVYQAPHLPEKDYLLRNRFRILLTKLEGFLTNREVERELHKQLHIRNYYWLKWLQRRKLFDLFEIEYKTALKQSTKSHDYQTAGAICEMAYDNYALHRLHERNYYETAKKLNDMHHAFTGSAYLNHLLKEKINEQRVNLSEHVTPDKEQMREEDFVVNLNYFKNPFSEYLEIKALLFTSSNAKRILILKKCLKILDKLGTSTEELKNEHLFCEATLALEYTLSGRHNRAYTLYRKLLESDCKLEVSIAKPIILDSLMKNTRKPVVPYVVSGPVFIGDEQHKYWLDMVEAGVLALLNDTHKLKKKLPVNFRGLPDYLKQSYRFYYSIYHYLCKQYDEAFREMVNFRQSKKLKKNPLDVDKVVCFFYRFYYLQKQENGLINYNANSLKRLLVDVKSYHNKATSDVKNYLPLRWLEQEIEACVTKTQDIRNK